MGTVSVLKGNFNWVRENLTKHFQDQIYKNRMKNEYLFKW